MSKKFFISRKSIIFTGAFIGIAAAILQKLGNPANMGICVACMERDIAGALGFHRAAVQNPKFILVSCLINMKAELQILQD